VFVYSKWFNIKEDLIYGNIKNCGNVIKFNGPGKYLFRSRCRWESEVRRLHLRLRGNTNVNYELGRQKSKIAEKELRTS
jgi:hypothetical protein